MDSNITDEELITLYKNSNDAKYVARLFDRYFHLLFGIGMKHLKDEDDANDTCMLVYEHLTVKLLTHEVDNFRSWVYRVTYNKCIDFLRSKNRLLDKQREYQLDEKENMEFSLFDSPVIDKEELLTHLEECLEGLKEEQKLCIKMFFLQQKRYIEIETKTGFILKKVKSYIQNGKRNLKICMDSKNG